VVVQAWQRKVWMRSILIVLRFFCKIAVSDCF
jgi:hypothetical protein